MTSHQPDPFPSADDYLARWEGILTVFREACLSDNPPAIAGLRAFLAGVPPDEQPMMLINLAAEHLKRTWQRGAGGRLEDYVAEYGGQFNELQTISAIPADLIEAEYLARHAYPWGDAPTLEEYQKRFPDRQDVFPLLQIHNRDDGRYVLIRRQGQGGLGRVWLAYDHHLRRHVAIKEPRPDLAGDAKILSRLAEESRMTARLDHPAIVSVHEFRESSEDAPFYVMRLIRGRTLRDVIADYYHGVGQPKGERRLRWNQLLRVLTTACQAIHYAHARGVIHSDLKTQNIVLGEFGETVVLDWGLAKRVADASMKSPEKSEAPTLSLASDKPSLSRFIGTPAYMAPEQLLGLADERTDVFCLGAILYEMLTGRAPYEMPGGELATTAFVSLVRETGFPPPSQVNPNVSKALEAVCLKAMARRPEDRYATPGELAQEVEHWLADEPVSAFTESWSVSAGRWMRNHQTLVGTTVIGLVIAFLSLAAVAGLIQRQKGELAQLNLDLEAANARESMAAALAKKTLEDMTSEDALNFLEKATSLRPEQKRLFERALEDYRQATARTPVDEREAVRQAQSYFRLALLQTRLGLAAPAELSMRAANKLFDRLAVEHPDVPGYRSELASSYDNMGVMLVDLGRPHEAEKEYRAALKEREGLVAEHPQDQLYRRDLATSHYNIGNLQALFGKHDLAEREYRTALKEQLLLVKDHPDVPEYLRGLATSHNNLANSLMQLVKPDEAEQEYRAALGALEQLVETRPREPAYRQALAVTHEALGNSLAESGRWKEAEKEYRAATQLLARLAVEHPQVPEYRQDLAGNHNYLGALFRNMKRPEEAEREIRAALEEQELLAAEYPRVPAYRGDLVRSRNNLANLLKDNGKRDDAEKFYRAALGEQVRLARETPDVAEIRQALAIIRDNLGRILVDAGKLEEARLQYGEALMEQEGLLAKHPGIPDLHSQFAETLVCMAALRNVSGSPSEALEYLMEAKPHHQAAIHASPANNGYRKCYRENLSTLVGACHKLGDHRGAVEAAHKLAGCGFDPAADHYDGACYVARSVPLAAKDVKLQGAKRAELVRSYEDQAMALLHQAADLGFKDAKQLAGDMDLASVRQRPDFQRLLDDLRMGKSKQGR
jgi:serine/threonine-protein kinase